MNIKHPLPLPLHADVILFPPNPTTTLLQYANMLRYFIYLSGYFVFSYEVNAFPCPVLNGLDSPQPLHGSNKTIPECSVDTDGLDGSSIQNVTFGILTVCLALASLIVGYLHYRQRDSLLATGTPYSRPDTQLEGEATLFF